MDRGQIAGTWSMVGMDVDIVDIGDGLAMAFPEAPEGFESRLVEIGEDEYVVRGGQFEGSRISFTLDEHGGAIGTVGGVPMLTRLDRPSSPPPGSGLAAPPLVIDNDIERRYRVLFDEVTRSQDGRNIDDELPTPPTPFVQWLMTQDAFIFHGSNRRDIDEFRPVRDSMELGDTGGMGNRGAVYGTHDGLWSMFFAVVDRRRLRGSIRNGVIRYQSADDALDLYHFSIHHEMLEQAPFTTGALYLLPRSPFERLPFYPGGPLSNEWVCPEPVRPLARLTIRPEDFPFLSRIGGHDDGALIEFGELGDEIYGRLVSVRRIDSGFEIVTTADRSRVDRFIEMSAAFYPDVKRAARNTLDGIVVAMTGPAAFLDAMGKKLAPHLSDER